MNLIREPNASRSSGVPRQKAAHQVPGKRSDGLRDAELLGTDAGSEPAIRQLIAVMMSVGMHSPSA